MLGGANVARQLFAKHFKLQQHVDYLSKTRVSVAVATPGRLQQLLEQGALSLAALSHVLLDESHRDAKERTLCAVPELRTEVVALMRGALGTRIREGNVQVVVY
ncbi:hypothetical protein CALVIDRAFT_538401 [Calocera viscosa TUFC12733]|uniref:DEAD/DEAH box helicase domain-containing protein n=1 Tax=Calocera viscosa (strain TUFC12733) TaxID=1330018 RepID=A0A167L246_CALVF|nr:hypothetical protein CALVIDRAFT_538401 [Calocera viscosa TUFC12733]